MVLIRSNKKMLKEYEQRRDKLTEVQYEHLVEKHVIRPSHSHYDVLVEYSRLGNNVYNQGLYRVRQALFAGKWM